MPTHIEIVPNAPIIIETRQPGEELSEDLSDVSEGIQRMNALLDAQPAPVYLILDLQGLKIPLDVLLKTSSQAARGPDAMLHHPKLIETVMVIGGDVFQKMSTAGLRSDAFGNTRINAFDTVAQALEYCHKQIAETAKK
jgi:hypothetical protein